MNDMFQVQAVQPTLFDRSRYVVQVTSPRVWPTPQYRRWWCSPRHARQKTEVLVRQNFRCWECRKLLNRRYFDLHHLDYEALGYEEGELVGVHRRCHEVLEEAKRQVCGCTGRGRAA